MRTHLPQSGVALWAALLALPSSVDQSRAVREDAPRIVVSVDLRRLWVIVGEDTLLSAPVAVGSGRTIRGKERSWTFVTPRGEATVVRKESDPVWVPPDWHYVETAMRHGFKVEKLSMREPHRLRDGSLLTVRGDVIGVLEPDSTFKELPVDEEIIFDNVLYIPPLGTRNRRIEGVLGPYRLVLSNGVGIHGTPYTASIGEAETHGCLRMYDDDISWLYENIPVGTRVSII
jgi:L,D-transpeptidase-like protein